MSNAVAIESEILTELPRLNSDVRFGPPEYLAGHLMQFAKNNKTGKYFRLGEREVFLLKSLDGQQTFDEIRANYRDRFGRTLTQSSLDQALSLFADYGLIKGLEHRAAKREIANATSGFIANGPFTGRIFSWDPDEWIGQIVKYYKWLINGPVFLAWSIGIIAAEIVVFSHAGTIWKQFLSHPAVSWPGRLAQIGLIGAAAMNVHEFGHALACKRFGGAVPEMGYLFRYLSFCAFTKLDDILLFEKRLHRIYVLIIGPLISLSVIPIALVIWMRSQPDSFAHMLSTDLLVLYNIGSLAQLIPILQLDGYFIVAQLLRMPDLRKDSYTFLLRWFLSAVSKRQSMTVAREHSRYLVPIYISYGLISLVASTFVIGFLLIQDGHQIVQAIGVIPAIAIACILLLTAAWRIYSITVPWMRSVLRDELSKGSL